MSRSAQRGRREDTQSPHPLTPLSSLPAGKGNWRGGTRLELLLRIIIILCSASIYITTHNTFISSLEDSLVLHTGPHLSITTSTKTHTLITNIVQVHNYKIAYLYPIPHYTIKLHTSSWKHYSSTTHQSSHVGFQTILHLCVCVCVRACACACACACVCVCRWMGLNC